MDKILCQTIKLTNKFFISKEEFFSGKERIESNCALLSMKILSESVCLLDRLMDSKPNVIGNPEYRALMELIVKNVSITKISIERSKSFNDSKINKKISTLPPTQVSATLAMIRIARSLDGMYASCLLRDMLSAEEIQNLGLDREGAGAVTVEAVGAAGASPSGG